MTEVVMTKADYVNNKILSTLVSLKQDLMAHRGNQVNNQKVAHVICDKLMEAKPSTNLVDALIDSVHDHMASSDSLGDTLANRDDLNKYPWRVREAEKLNRINKALAKPQTVKPFLYGVAWVTEETNSKDYIVPVTSDALLNVVNDTLNV